MLHLPPPSMEMDEWIKSTLFFRPEVLTLSGFHCSSSTSSSSATASRSSSSGSSSTCSSSSGNSSTVNLNFNELGPNETSGSTRDT
ncbi:hypothetical protein ElyMa_000120800 [Elysia marginata]|uniref:Uncharacterized protein n=1 Tax=Elysia marginata TaxID=1093978 RepID=A0AAV4ENG8_9GAST|nr:hypothetical protein ElyMa_000120800 [Elysia marginata]